MVVTCGDLLLMFVLIHSTLFFFCNSSLLVSQTLSVGLTHSLHLKKCLL